MCTETPSLENKAIHINPPYFIKIKVVRHDLLKLACHNDMLLETFVSSAYHHAFSLGLASA
jgi:hypothetical protein